MTVLVLDSEAIAQLTRRESGAARGVIHAALTAATIRGSDVLVPAAVLAEQYRGGRHQATDACLARYPGIQVVDTTRLLAKRIGNLLARAGRGSADHVDAAVVAVAAAAPSAVIFTSDPDDLLVIGSSLPGLTIRGL